MPGALLHCPIRGPLTVPEHAADGLTNTEEKRRIDCIRFLLAKSYPRTHIKVETTLLRFGHQGKNSFRTDLAVTDVPVSSLPHDLDALKSHAKLVAEIKRDNAQAATAKQTQVYPALDFLHDISALGVYWDDVEQRLFYRKLEGTRTTTHEVTLAVLPQWGQALGSPLLRCEDLLPSPNLLLLFEKIEDRLHSNVVDKTRRFELMLQLLLAKLFDENTHQAPHQEMAIQDFSDTPLGDKDVVKAFNEVLQKATNYYGKYLPKNKKVSSSIALSGEMLRSVSALLAPVKILGSKRDVIQSFYMYFAKGVYKWDLAQYFTPSEVVDFIVSLVNPRAGDQIKDPACGSGDFLTSSLHYARKHNADIHDAIWGADHSEQAVQVCVLNMVLNGDGKSNIKQEDSLENVNQELDGYSVMLCNPPFGIRITERRFNVLKEFDLGHDWQRVEGVWEKTDKVRKTQETGLLFAELCIKQASADGRVGIILPNGYLGNRSSKYLAFREWLLRHTRVVAIIGFPRFTFKKSGADVSASVVVLEKRKKPLARAVDAETHPFYVGILEAVGWSVDKKAERLFKREPTSGAFLTDSNNERIIAADFDRVLQDLWGSQVSGVFPWITDGIDLPKDLSAGWSVNISEVLARPDLPLDPKRWCARAVVTRQQIAGLAHFRLGEVVNYIKEEGVPKDKQRLFRYVEIQDIADGAAMPKPLRGWELPDRAKHGAQKGDIYVGSIWSSVGKWFVAGGDCDAMLVSNGFHRLRIKPGKEGYLLDIVAGLNTEMYRIQARSFATGSDGLAEVSPSDLLDIVLPRVTDEQARASLQNIVDALLSGRSTIASVVSALAEEGKIPVANVVQRSSHVVQV